MRNMNWIRGFAAVILLAAAGTGIVRAFGVRGLDALQDTDRRAASITTQVKHAPGAPARRNLEFYSSGIPSTLFGAPTEPKPTPPLAPKKAQMTNVTPVQPVADPFTDYAYSGTVSSGGQTMALIENRKTREGWFLATGQPFLGGTVTLVDERQVVISLGTTTRTLAKTDDYKLVPLDKSASFLSGGTDGAPPAAPGGGTPGGPGGGPGAMRGGMPMGMNVMNFSGPVGSLQRMNIPGGLTLNLSGGDLAVMKSVESAVQGEVILGK